MKKLHDNVAQRHKELAIWFRDACDRAFGTVAQPVRDMFAKGWRGEGLGEILAFMQQRMFWSPWWHKTGGGPVSPLRDSSS
ncbi:hypothetical protein LR48_Vigan02g005900 [Vigna angularis]|uniref:Uncharacterized protein n=1 Tax=Phaseolus angularis TaxID=3914 RepID=A0A0L9TUQ6_PHAAN|nr:hypothetical protein LR48_Vigan02g005900 [Vigna angularis]